MSSDNPFASPEGSYNTPNIGGNGSVQPRSSVDYFEAYGKVFENQNWFVNILIVGIGNFIPIIGPMVLAGFGATIVNEKSTGQTNSYPDFNLNKFGEYLIRGFWIFLVVLVAALCIAPVAAIAAMVMGALQASGNNALALLGFLIYFVAMIGINILTGLAIIPLFLRAGLMSSFSEAFDLAWLKDFISKMWVEQIIGAILLAVISWIVMLVGLIALCIGMIPAAGVVMIAYCNFVTQLYQVYIGRGGQPIPYRDSGSL